MTPDAGRSQLYNNGSLVLFFGIVNSHKKLRSRFNSHVEALEDGGLLSPRRRDDEEAVDSLQINRGSEAFGSFPPKTESAKEFSLGSENALV